MKSRILKILAVPFLVAILVPSMANAGNVKKTYINISKEGSQATAADLGNITTNYSKISTAVSQMTYLKAQGSQFGKVVPIYKTATIGGGTFKTEKSQGAEGLGNAFNNNGVAIWAPTTPELDAIKNEYTVEFWMNQDNYSRYASEYEVFGRVHSSTSHGKPFMIRLYGDYYGAYPTKAGKLSLHSSTLNTDGTYSDKHTLTSPQLEKNRWYHIAFAYHKDKGVQLYIDGVPIGKRTGTRGEVVPAGGGVSNIPVNTKSLASAILVRPNWHNNNVNNTTPTNTAPNPYIHIDEIRIWNVDRSAQEIKDNYNKPLTGKEKGLVYYLNFDE